MLLLNAGNTVHYKSDDLLLIFHQLLELVCQNCVQFLRLERRQIASSFSALTVHPALPVFCVSLHSFEALPMKGGSMLSANDFPAVWILALVTNAVSFRSGTAFLEYLICLIPKFFRYNRRDIRIWVCYPLAFIKKYRFFLPIV